MAAWRSARRYHTSCKGKPTGSQSAELNAQSPNRPPDLAKSLCKVTPVFVCSDFHLQILASSGSRVIHVSSFLSPLTTVLLLSTNTISRLTRRITTGRTSKNRAKARTKSTVRNSDTHPEVRTWWAKGRKEASTCAAPGNAPSDTRSSLASCAFPTHSRGWLPGACLCCAERYSRRRVSLHVAKMAWPVVRAAIKLPYRSRLSTAQGLHGMKRKNSNSGGLA